MNQQDEPATLRDRFAMAALQRMHLWEGGHSMDAVPSTPADKIANYAYEVADAMLERRKR